MRRRILYHKAESEPEIIYNDPEVKLSYDNIDSLGGTSEPNIIVTQTYTNTATGETYPVSELKYNTSYSILSSNYDATITRRTGIVTVEQKNQGFDNREVAVVECTVTANQKSTTKTATVIQDCTMSYVTPDSVIVTLNYERFSSSVNSINSNASFTIYSEGSRIDSFTINDDDLDEKLAYYGLLLTWIWDGNDAPLSDYVDDAGLIEVNLKVSYFVVFNDLNGTIKVDFPFTQNANAIPLGTVTLNIGDFTRQEKVYGQNTVNIVWDVR